MNQSWEEMQPPAHPPRAHVTAGQMAEAIYRAGQYGSPFAFQGGHSSASVDNGIAMAEAGDSFAIAKAPVHVQYVNCEEPGETNVLKRLYKSKWMCCIVLPIVIIGVVIVGVAVGVVLTHFHQKEINS